MQKLFSFLSLFFIVGLAQADDKFAALGRVDATPDGQIVGFAVARKGDNGLGKATITVNSIVLPPSILQGYYFNDLTGQVQLGDQLLFKATHPTAPGGVIYEAQATLPQMVTLKVPVEGATVPHQSLTVTWAAVPKVDGYLVHYRKMTSQDSKTINDTVQSMKAADVAHRSRMPGDYSIFIPGGEVSSAVIPVEALLAGPAIVAVSAVNGVIKELLLDTSKDSSFTATTTDTHAIVVSPAL